MAEVKLKKKITLRRKQEEAAFTFGGKLKVNLYWTSDTDLDLCLFFRKKDGEVGGVFSNEYRQKKSDLGSLEKFPFMLHLGDNKEPAPGGEESEQINIAKLDDIDEAFVALSITVQLSKVMMLLTLKRAVVSKSRATAVTIWKYSQTHQMKVTCTAYVQSRIRVESSLLRTKAEL